MSAQLSALLGVVAGALLAGGSSLLLAWRGETIQGRAGVHLIREILREAKKEVKRLIDEGDDAVWKADQLPDSKLWAQYRQAVTARLSLSTLQKIDKAMRTLDSLNSAATRAWDQNAELERQMWKATELPDETANRMIDKLAQEEPQRLGKSARERLPQARAELEEALEAMKKVAPSGRTVDSVIPWCRWHIRSLAAACVIAIVGAAAVLGLLGSSSSDAVEVQNALAAHLGDPAVTACEPIHDTANRFSCIAVETAPGSACPVGDTAGRGGRSRVVSYPSRTVAEGSCGDEPVDRILSILGERREEADCTVFVQTAESEAVSQADLTKPGFLAKLKAKLRREDQSTAEVPPVILPGTAFTAGC